MVRAGAALQRFVDHSHDERADSLTEAGRGEC